MQIDNNKFLIMAGPNVIENEEHTMLMASELKKIFEKFHNFQYVFKTSFDKANRTSVNSYRGLGMDEGLRILKKVKDEYNLPIITDVHEPWQCEPVAKVVDILQIPAFLCRQTDLIEAAAKTNKIIHVKKGQFLNAQSMIKVVEKFRAFGHTNKIILCERGNMYGYNDLVVDTRNLVWLKGKDNLVSMDITHCLQQPGQTHADGTVKAGGLREFIPLMGKIALVSGVDAIFMEVHDRPEEAKCDGPTQWSLDKLEDLLKNFNIYINSEQKIYPNDIISNFDKINDDGYIVVKNLFSKKFCEDCILDLNTSDNIKINNNLYSNFNKTNMIYKILENESLNNFLQKFFKCEYNVLWFKVLNKINWTGQDVEYHQELIYNKHMNINEDESIQLFLALDDHMEENGCLNIIPKSHLNLENHETFYNIYGDEKNRVPNTKLNKLVQKNGFYKCIFNPGDCIIFKDKIIHGSSSNSSFRNRYGVAISFVKSDIKISNDSIEKRFKERNKRSIKYLKDLINKKEEKNNFKPSIFSK